MLKKIFNKIHKATAFIVNSVFLTIAYFIGVGLTWLLFRKRFEDRPYWQELNLKNKKMEDYYRQW